MFLPKYPANPTPPPAHSHTTVDPAPVQRTAPQISVSTGAVAAVLVGGVVLLELDFAERHRAPGRRRRRGRLGGSRRRCPALDAPRPAPPLTSRLHQTPGAD